jgi:DNA repair exonuclease SbcCD nuclease subunit
MLASSRDVDFILLGGDLFHKAQPSSNTLNR